MIRKLLVPVRGDGKGDNVLAHAAALAHAHGAHVEVVHCRLRPEDLMPFGVAVSNVFRRRIEEAARENAAGEAERLREEFRGLAARMGLAEAPPVAGRATAGFVDFDGKMVDAVRRLGRLSDLVCVPQPDKARNLGANTLRSALFSSGRPVLMCPPRADRPERLGERVAIGWNGSLEAARAVAQAMGLLERAADVAVLSAGPSYAAPPEELVDYLAMRGVAAGTTRFEERGDVGRSLLKAAEAAGADMLVMGAYHDGWEREAMFGGVTQRVVDKARLPVVMVH
jgi:nucleotide-binding universal stress UspA family protein